MSAFGWRIGYSTEPNLINALGRADFIGSLADDFAEIAHTRRAPFESRCESLVHESGELRFYGRRLEVGLIGADYTTAA